MSVDYQKNLQVPVRENKPNKNGKVGNTETRVTVAQGGQLSLPNIGGSRSNTNSLKACFADNTITAKTCAEAFFNTVIDENSDNYNPDFPTGVDLGMNDATGTNTPNDKPSSHGPNATYPQVDNVLTDPSAAASSEYNRTPSENYGYTIASSERDDRGFDGGETINNIKKRYNAE